MLITGITGPWFKVTTDALEPYTKVDIPMDYFKGSGETLKDRTKYTDRGLIQECFEHVGTTYIYLTKITQVKETYFTIELSPNTTGQPRSFTLGFPYSQFGSIQHEWFTVTQQ